MKITSEISLRNFEGWSGAVDTLNTLTDEQKDALESNLEELYPDGMDETSLNDLLRFENDAIAEWLGFEDWEDLERENSGEDDEEDDDEEDEEDETEE